MVTGCHNVLAVEELQGEIGRLPALILCMGVLPYAHHRESRDIAAAAKNEPKFAFSFQTGDTSPRK
jgi:hypothetical protein